MIQRLCVLLILILFSCVGYAASDRPNVIVIMADDMGAEALACYDSSIYTTPNLDRMASQGALFWNAYSTPLCTPTRVMIMTGQYPNRTGFKKLISKAAGVRLPARYPTFGNYFKEAGYKTAMAGKWQLGRFDEYPNQPVEHGFDAYCMWKWFYEGKKTKRFYGPGIYQNGASADGGEEVYGPDVYNDFVLDFIERNAGGPFFVYYPMTLVHAPFVAPPALKELAYQKYPKKGLGKDTATYGHMITYCDQLVGNVLDKLKAKGIDENTLVIFTGDNGCPKQILSELESLKLKGGKGSMAEAGTRVPFIARWPGRIEPGVREALISLVDVLPTVAAVAGIAVKDEVDGLDLSHNLLGGEGKDRGTVLISYREGFLAREKRFRLHEDGKFYDIPVTSNFSRYGETESDDKTHPAYGRLKGELGEFMEIESTLTDEEEGLLGRK